jgi:hypothetical protein
MSFNLYDRLRGLFPKDRLQVGTINAIDAGQASITLVDGTMLIARGSGSVGDQVYVRGGLIEGQAPSLPIFEIEI